MKKLIIYFVFLNLCSISLLYSGSINSSPVLMLDTTSVEGLSIANNSVMQYGKINFILDNPGIIGSLNQLNVNFSYLPWIFDTMYFVGNIGYGFSGGGVGFSFASFNSKDFDYILKDGSISSDKLSTSELLFALGSGMELIKNKNMVLSAGLSVKFISSKIYTFSRNGFAVDAGVSGVYNLHQSRKFIYGLALQNIGSGQKFINEKNKLPFKIRAGGGYSFIILPLHRLIPMVEYIYDTIGEINTGMEYSYNNRIFLRAGYMISSQQDVFSGLTSGIGAKYKSLKIDYALRILRQGERQLLHSFSFGYSL